MEDGMALLAIKLVLGPVLLDIFVIARVTLTALTYCQRLWLGTIQVGCCRYLDFEFARIRCSK